MATKKFLIHAFLMHAGMCFEYMHRDLAGQTSGGMRQARPDSRLADSKLVIDLSGSVLATGLTCLKRARHYPMSSLSMSRQAPRPVLNARNTTPVESTPAEFGSVLTGGLTCPKCTRHDPCQALQCLGKRRGLSQIHRTLRLSSPAAS